MVFMVMRLEEIIMRMSVERDEDKGLSSKFLVTQFPVVTVINNHTFSGLKQHRFIILWSGFQKSQIGFYVAKIKELIGLHFF